MEKIKNYLIKNIFVIIITVFTVGYIIHLYQVQRSLTLQLSDIVQQMNSLGDTPKQNLVLKYRIIELEEYVEKLTQLYNQSVKQIIHLEDENEKLKQQLNSSI